MTFGKLDGQWGFVLGTSDNVYHTARELFFCVQIYACVQTHRSQSASLAPCRWGALHRPVSVKVLSHDGVGFAAVSPVSHWLSLLVVGKCCASAKTALRARSLKFFSPV